MFRFRLLALRIAAIAFGLCGIFSSSSCARKTDQSTLVLIIESSPTNLDPRVGIDAQSERLDGLIFDNLLTHDEHFNAQPGLAERWEVPNPLTYIFHLHKNVRFHDGRPLTSRDVKWSFDSLVSGKIRSAKSATFRSVNQIEAPDENTVIFHLKEPFAALLWNLSGSAMGVVPYGSGEEITKTPIGSGPFRFVSAEQDKDVVLERFDSYWGEKAELKRVRMAVIPDATTRALELQKGSADIAMNSLGYDMIPVLKKNSSLQTIHAPGTILQYMAFNLRDPILKDARVRQALAYAIDRQPIIHYLFLDYVRPAVNLLPPESWAFNSDIKAFAHDPGRARELLDAAGYRPVNGVRFHLTMKTSSEEGTRLLAAVLQQQLREVGIQLDIRSFEFATFFSDVTRGEFQLYSLRWVGSEDPDIFEHTFHSSMLSPKGANRGFYVNPRIDALIDKARGESDQNVRKQIYAEVQSILAQDLPYINLWYIDNVLIANRRVKNLTLSSSGNYDFLKTAELQAP